MSGLIRARIVCFLVLFLMLTVPWSAVIEPSSTDVDRTELSEHMVGSASAGDMATQLHLYGSGAYSNQFTIDVPTTAPVTDLHLAVKPAITPSSTGFSWSDAAAWSHTDSMKEGTVLTSEGYLTGSIAGTIWDFNNGLQGWTVSSSTYVGQYTINSCGYNGSQGGSLKTQAGSSPEHATSPSMNLVGSTGIPLHIWIRQGSSSCGEEADSGEDLKLQYKTTTGSWITLQTWLGSTSGGTSQQWFGVLPAAALHSTSQLRFEQVRGSGTCCDFWFIDDVHIASPPVSNWTSPSFGWSSTSAIQVPQNTYAPLTIDAFIPTGAMLNWSVHQANGNAIPGFKGSNTNQIPLNILDPSLHDSFRIKLSFKVGSNGELPLVYSISGDGASSTFFTEQQPMEDWTSVCNPEEQFTPYGPVTDLSIIDDGWAYLSTTSASTISARGTGLVAEISATPYLLNQADYISSPTTVGHLYTSSTGVSTSGGNGSGLTVNTVASSITVGLVDGVNLVDAGTGYTSQTASPTGGSGSGVSLNITASAITASGLVGQSSSLVGGSGYTTATGVLTSGGDGSNLTLNIIASSIISGIAMSYNGLNGGTNYSLSSSLGTTGGTGTGLRVSITNISGGSVGAITIVSGGSNYLVGDKIYITQGDGDAYFFVSGITRSGGVITSISINNPGENYLVGNTVNLSGGDGNAYFSISQVVREGGSITSFTIANQGTGYSVTNLLSISGGDGNGQFSVGSIHHIGGNISSITINARGTGYAIGDQMSISGGDGAGAFTVNAVRHWGGEITAVAVQNGGQYYALGDEVTAQGGAQNATLGVTGIESVGYRGDSNCTLTMDEKHLTAPASTITGSVIGTNIQLQLLESTSPASWVTVTTPSMFNYSSSTPLYDLQFRIVALDINLSYWTIDSFDYLIHYGQVASNPRIDFYDDQVYEWGTTIANLGTWGWQDHFSNGNTTIMVQPGLSGYASTTILVPQTDIHSFGFGAIASNQNITGYTLLHQSQVILSETLEPASLHNILLNASERSLIKQSISGYSGLNQLGTRFIEMDLEVYGSGPIVLGGLLLTYTASDSVQFQTNSPFIMNLNDARRGLLDIEGVHHIPLPLTSSQKGGVSVQILGLNASSNVTLIDSEWSPESNTLTPSQRWRTVSMVHSVIGVSPSAVRLDVVDSNNHATWVIPLSGGTPYGTGDYDLLALHPSNAVTYNHSGTTVTVEVSFRILPSWDDADVIRISTRLQLMNSILSMPSTFTFGDFASLGYENDLEIKNVMFSDEGDGTLFQDSDYYLMTGMSLKLSTVVGFENVSSNDAFMDGDAILSLYRGETFVANTTSLDDNIWNYTDTVPFTSGPLTWRLELTSSKGLGLTDAAVFERTFHVDSVKPRVLETSVDWYDHREPSTTQTMHIQITDQPTLPTNIH
ncbi:MAG TPA: hypothetical protein EYQ58_06975, partial [Candidatus Poseidoniales archaeon]|nr:hypothetical protein [Candidatus Poseidoniales archaeon]